MKQNIEEKLEEIGVLIDRLDSLTYSLNMPIPDDIHVKGMRGSLPSIVGELKIAYDDLNSLLGED